MRRALVALAALWLALGAIPAQAQMLPMLLVHTAKPVTSCTGGYTGIGDFLAGAKGYWGLQAYTCAYAGANGKAINLIRASDSHTCDVLFATSGSLGNTANCSTGTENGTAVATWCNATTCSVVTAYDQSGANQCSGAAPCNATQATAAKRPTLKLSGCATITGGSPCISYAQASAQTLNTTTTTAITTTTGIIVAAVANYINSGSSGAVVATNGSSSYEILAGFGTNDCRMLDGGSGPVQTGCTAAAAHQLIGLDRGTAITTDMQSNGTSSTGAAGASNGWNGLIGIGSFTTGDFFNGEIEEVAVYAGTTTTGLCHNQRLRWGTGGAC